MNSFPLRTLVTLALAAGLVAQAGAAETPQPRTSTNRFGVQLDGVGITDIAQIDFLNSAERSDGDGPRAPYLLRLTRPLTKVTGRATDFLAWRQQNIGGRVDRRSLVIILYDPTFTTETGRISLFNCAALAWNGPALSGSDAPRIPRESVDVGCQTVELAGAF